MGRDLRPFRGGHKTKGTPKRMGDTMIRPIISFRVNERALWRVLFSLIDRTPSCLRF
jgi:hypothetical protein